MATSCPKWVMREVALQLYLCCRRGLTESATPLRTLKAATLPQNPERPEARTICTLDCFSVFEATWTLRRGKWKWSVCTNQGKLVMQGFERSRSAAKYRANRALFLLLAAAPYRSTKLDVK